MGSDAKISGLKQPPPLLTLSITYQGGSHAEPIQMASFPARNNPFNSQMVPAVRAQLRILETMNGYRGGKRKVTLPGYGESILKGKLNPL